MEPGLRRPIDVDLYGYFAPKYVYGNAEMTAGRLPLWNPYEYGGMPFIGAAQPAALYPVKIAVFALGGRFALHAYVVCHLVLAGILAFVAFRGLGLAPGGAMLGVVAWVFTAINMDSLYHPFRIACLAWVPLVFLAFVRTLDRPGPRPAAALALAAAMLFVAGYPEYALDTAVALGVFAVVAAPARGWQQSAARRLGWIALATVVAACLAALQILSTLDMARESWRVVGTEGPPAAPDVVALLTRERLLDPHAWRTVTQAFHMAPVVWLLAVAGALFAPHRLRAAFAVLWVVLFAVATVLAGLLHALPGFALLRGNYCWVGLSYFPAAWLAGAGLDTALGAVATRPAGPLAKATFAVVLLATAAMIGAAAWPVVAAALALVALRGLAGARLVAVALAGLVLFSLWTWKPASVDATLPQRYARKESPYPTVPPPTTGLAAALRGRCGPEPGRLLAPFHVWNGTAIVEKVEMVQGYPDSIAPGRMRRVLDHAGLDFEQRLLPDWDRVAASGRLLDMLNVACILVPTTERIDADRLGVVEALRAERDVAYRRPSALPRAYLVRRALTVPDGDAAFAAVTRPAFDPRADVVLEDAAPALEPGEGRVEVLAASPGGLDLAVETSGAALLVVSQGFFPGWRAHVDGARVGVQRADYVLMALPVPAGTHRVALRYRPRSAVVGGALSAFGAIATAALLGAAG
jgi:hypothetical protein